MDMSTDEVTIDKLLQTSQSQSSELEVKRAGSRCSIRIYKPFSSDISPNEMSCMSSCFPANRAVATDILQASENGH